MKTKRILLLFLSLIVCILVGCKSTQLIKLDAPSNLNVTDCVLTWDNIENADGYVVYVDHKEYETTETTFDLSFLDVGKYVIKVMALGDDEDYTNSKWTKFIYKVEKKEEIIPTEGLKYTLLEDGTGYEVHRGEANLEGTIVIPDTYNGLPVKKISEMAFQLAKEPDPYSPGQPGCNKKTTGIRLPKHLEEIGDNAFGYCLYLSDVTIPKGVKSIGKEAFAYNMTVSIVIPDGVENIGDYAFMFNPMEEASLPNTLKNIPNGLFYVCPNLKTICFPEKIESFGHSAVLETKWYKDFPNDYVTVNNFLLGYKGTAPMDDIPKTVTHIADRAFSNRLPTTNLQIELNVFEKAVLPSSITLGAQLFYGNHYIKEVVLEDGIKVIQDYMFYRCSGLEKVTIPQSVEAIGEHAFGGAALKKVELPVDFPYISPGAFGGCPLEEIVWPENLVEIGEGAFSLCNFENLSLPQSVKTIGEAAFSGSSFQSVTLPDNLNYIGDEAFRSCKKMSSINIPSSVSYFGKGIFGTCELLDNVVLPEGMATIPESAFINCKGLKSIYLPNSVKEIGKMAFSNCTALESIQLPSNLQSIGDSAFSGCEKLKAFYPPESVKTIGNNGFSACKGLEEIDLSKVESIGEGVFLSCKSLKKVVLPKHITAIPKSFFYGCTNLTELVLPKGLKTISQYAFNACSALERIYFEGTEMEFSLVSVEAKNDMFLNATVYFYSENEPTLNNEGTAYNGNYWHYDTDNKTPIAWVKEMLYQQ